MTYSGLLIGFYVIALCAFVTHPRVATGLPRCVHADTSGDTGKQKTESKTPYFSLKYVQRINLNDVMRYCMICRFV